MPPFKLQIITEQEVLQAPTVGPAGSLPARHNELEDWKIKPDGKVAMLGKSMKEEYVFGQDGLIKAAGMDAPHEKVSQDDIMLISQLGAGACATVDKGYHRTQRKFVAVKRVSVTNKELRQQMLRDIKILSDAKEVPGLLSFLGAYLDQQREQLGRLPEDVMALITSKLLCGLAFMHEKRMVHRDIKPANILLNLSGEAKLSDFGISATVDHTMAQCNTYAGTVTYMSPERLESRPYNFLCDIWSLGLVLVESLTGRYPYYQAASTGGPLELSLHVLQDEPPVPPPGAVSDLCRDFLASCLQKDPARRRPASVLLSHPWLSLAGAVNLKGLLRQVMYSDEDKLVEIAFHFSFTYYNMLGQAAAAAAAGGGAGAGACSGNSAGEGAFSELAHLYLDHSLLTHEGVGCQGRAAIMAKLEQVVQTYAGFSRAAAGGASGATWQLQTVDCQDMLETGCLIVTVTGEIQLGPAGGAKAGFAESFILGQIPSQGYYVANQIFRLRT